MGITPTEACRESGAGAGFMGNLKRGSSPSIDRVEMLAKFFNCTIGELIGERPPSIPSFPAHPDLVILYDQLSETAQQEVMAFVEFKRTQETKAVKGSIPLETLGDTRPAGAKEFESRKEKKQIE